MSKEPASRRRTFLSQKYIPIEMLRGLAVFRVVESRTIRSIFIAVNKLVK